MSATARAISAQSARKAPGTYFLPRKQPAPVSQDQINQIKFKTQQIQLETRQLKSKTARMKQITKERASTINEAFSHTVQKQKIQTASPIQLKLLQDQVSLLEHSLETRKNELYELEHCDKLQVSEEIKVEIQMYYLEHLRLKRKAEASKKSSQIVASELQRLKKIISQTRSNERNVVNIQDEINQYVEKLFAYSKNETRIKATQKLKQLRNHPEEFKAIHKSVEDEIKQEEKLIRRNDRLNDKILETEEKNVDYLHSVIDALCDEIHNRQEEDKVIDEDESDNKDEINNEED